MLRPLLRVGEKARGESGVFLRSRPAADRTCDRARFHFAAPTPHQHFRRRAEDRRLLRLQVEEVGRRVERTQRSIDLEGIDAERPLPALGQDDLVDLPGEDRLPGGLDRAQESRFRYRGSQGRTGVARVGGDGGRRPRGIGHESFEPVEPREGLFRGARAAFGSREIGARQQQEAMAGVVERDDRVEEEEEGVGHPAFAGVSVRNLLEQPRRVVGQIADRARAERRKVGVGHETLADGESGERLERAGAGRLGSAVAFDHDVSIADDQAHRRRDAQERVTRDRLASFDALEQEAFGAGALEPPEKVDRVSIVAGKLARDRKRPAVGAGENRAFLLSPAAHEGRPPIRIRATSSRVTSATPKSRAWAAAWTANISRPETARQPAARAARTVDVSRPSRR